MTMPQEEANPHVQIWQFPDEGRSGVDLDGIIVCSVPHIVEQKWPGITDAIARGIEDFASSIRKAAEQKI